MTRLLLIRHGQTTSNVTHSLDTRLPGAALTDLGWHQAFAAGERIATEARTDARTDARTEARTETGPPVSGVPDLLLVSSEALRARQTAAGIMAGAGAFGVIPQATGPGSEFASQVGGLRISRGIDVADIRTPANDHVVTFPTVATVSSLSSVPTAQHPTRTPGAVPGISEIPAGDFEMRNDAEAHDIYHRTFATWLGGAMDLHVPGALNGRAVVERYLGSLFPMLAVARSTGSDLAVVSHGAVIRLIAGYLGAVEPEFALRTLLPNTSRVELEVPDVGILTPSVPDLPTVDAPMVDTAAYLPQREVAGGVSTGSISGPWKVTDWAGHGEPPLIG